ncbi:MAG: hypothetical protein AAF688_06045 [Bacteroidota bacterium]
MNLNLKKIFGLLTCLVLFTAVNCENEPLDEDFFDDQNNSCAVAAQSVADAALNFIGANADNYEQLCTAYRIALEGQIQACGDVDGILQATVDSLGDCSEQPNECQTATNAANVAETAFNAATSDNFTQLCNAFKTALQNKIDACGDDDGSIQTAIDNLGDCSNNQQTTNIPGTWKLTAWNIDGGLDLDNDGTASVNVLDEMDCYNNETIVFNADGTASVISTSFADIESEFELGSNDEFDFTVECIQDDETTTGTWTEDSNTLTFTYDDFDETIEFTIENNDISYFIPNGFTTFGVEFSTDMTIVYTKQE